jgi:uncharacterized membrane protein YtjA (UPF0391 family)
MLKWAVIFGLISLIAALFGFTGISHDAAGISKFLFAIALVLFLVFLIMGLFFTKKVVNHP